MLVVLVSTRRSRPEIFPTHRVFAGRSGSPATRGGADPDAALERLARRSARARRRSSRRRRAARRSCAGERASSTSSSSTASATTGSRYTPDADEARAPRRRAARPRPPSCSGRRASRTSSRSRARGEVLPQKSTYFFPKLVSRPALPARCEPAGSSSAATAVADIRGVLASCRRASSASPCCGAGRGRRRHDRDRRGRRGASSSRGSRRSTRASRSSRRSSASELRHRRALARRRRPDRRLAEREARHPVLLALARRRRGRDDGRRRLRLRLRLRHGRGVDGRRAAAARSSTGVPLGAVRPKDEIEILSFEATTTARSRTRPPRSPGSPTACGSWARSRSRSATSRPAASTASARSSRPARSTSRRRSCSSASAGSRSISSRRRRSTAAPLDLVGAHASSRRERPSCARSWLTPCPHRLLRLELRELAPRRLLPGALSCPALARVLRAAVRHGRGERDLLPAADREGCAGLGRPDARRLPLHRQGEPLPDAHQAPDRARPRARALLRADRAARTVAEARAGALAAPADLQAGRRPAGASPRAAASRKPRLGVPARELVRGGRLRPPPRARSRARPRRRRSAALRGPARRRPTGPFSVSITALAAAAATTPRPSSPSGRSASRRSKGRRTSTSTTTGRASRPGTRCASRSLWKLPSERGDRP